MAKGRGAGGGGVGAEVGLGEGDGEGGVGGEVQGGVAFAPVSGSILSVLLETCKGRRGGGGGGVLDHCDVHWSGRACAVDLLVGHFVGTSLV